MNTNVVSVQGKGEITVKPDVAYLSIGVVTKAKTAQEAKKSNSEKAAKLTKLLKETCGINKKISKPVNSRSAPIIRITIKRERNPSAGIWPVIRWM
ncbi:SIMPL domain-containing protein [Paenibacillus sp. FSL P4-0127]|uniref:SIMPL domain-containing protein n=1 Tax=Paenibacillus sp. FSL M7-0831 TaxID=2975314 RepID=UPI0009E43B38|nr:SIMPL domain-containing protein [Paenibacillus macerans]